MLLRIAALLCLATAILHALALSASSQATAGDPISALSQGPWGVVHTVSIVLFGVAQILLSAALGGLDRGRFWPLGRALLGIAGAGLFVVAYYFAAAEPEALRGPGANDPLWAVATVVGFAMGLLQPGLRRLSPGLGRFNALCLAVWLLLIPAILLIGVISLGAYERSVGVVYLAWVGGVSVAVGRRSLPQRPAEI